MLQSFAVTADDWVPVIAAVISAASSLASLLNFPSVDDANMYVYTKYMVIDMNCVSILQLDPEYCKYSTLELEKSMLKEDRSSF